jgi:nucleoside-diphosphate-sugar epimerase
MPLRTDDGMSQSKFFGFGFGYTAQALARRLGRGWRFAGTCRHQPHQAALAQQGIEARIFDGARPMEEPMAALLGTTHLLSSVPPGEDGDPVLMQHGAEIAHLSGLHWLGYLSTTGVYGDRAGGWVDEASELTPTGPRGRRRMAAESAWLDLHRRHGLPVHVFRLAGIYGPGRCAIESLRQGRAQRIDKPGQVFSRIHVDDIAAVLAASMARPNPGAVYNVCDDDPAAPSEVTAYAAGLLGMEPPPLISFAEAEVSDMALSFYADNKRVRNERIKHELGVKLAYPDYRQGLTAILRSERAR